MPRSNELSGRPFAGTFPGAEQGPLRRELSIEDLLGILSRRRAVILGTLAAVLLLSFLLCIMSTRLYKATAEVQVKRDTADALSLNTMIETGDGPIDTLESNVTLQTEAQILQSESLALDVIKTLQLENTADFEAGFHPIGWLIGLLSPGGNPDAPNAPLENAPVRRSHVIKIFERRLKVKPVAGTRLIDIEFLSRDPRTAAAVVNQLVEDLSEYNFETRHIATKKASVWLAAQLAALRKDSEDQQVKLVNMQHGAGVFSLGQTDAQGKEELYTPVLDRLQQATSLLTQAQSARIMKGALYQVVKSGDPELISGLAGNSTLSSASPVVTSSLALLQSLRGQEAQTQALVEQLADKFGPGYPKLTEMRASLASIQAAIRDESQRIASRAQNDYLVAQQIEEHDRQISDTLKSQAEIVNNQAVKYEIVRQEAVQSWGLYDSLLHRMQEADLVAGLRSSNITLVDPGRVAPRPAKPNLLVYAGGGLVGGLLLGICAAFVRESTDNLIHDLGELEFLGINAPIGFLPHHSAPKAKKHIASRPESIFASGAVPPIVSARRANSMVAASAPRSIYTEALRALRTTLMQPGNGAAPPQVLLITSSVPGEGKSMLSINLAIVFAQSGKRVLLVDCDLRTPTLDKRLEISTTHGLSSLLSAGSGADELLQPVPVYLEGAASLELLPAGDSPAYPAELLASERMAEQVRAWRKRYDYILIDGAPLLPVTDSALLSRLADFTIVVARHNKTDRRSLERTCQILRSQGVRRMGVVLNSVKSRGDNQYRCYGYKQDQYYAGGLSA